MIKNNIINITQIITKEKSTSYWTSSYQINTELGTLSKHQTSPNIFKNFFKIILDNYKDFQRVYTDGSKTRGVGFLIIFPKEYFTQITHTFFHIHSQINNYPIISMAIEIIIQEAHCKYILSNFLSTLKSHQNQFNSRDIATKTRQSQQLGHIIIMWIPGYITLKYDYNIYQLIILCSTYLLYRTFTSYEGI